MTRRAVRLWCLCTALLAAPGTAPAAPVKGLTHPDALARALQFAYDADFDAADRELRRVCPTVPAAACETARTVALWWQLFLDPFNRNRDAAFMAQAGRAIALADAWAAREPQRAEAWFYVGASYGARLQLRVQRQEYLSAARDGKTIRQALERALAIDPDLHDAHFGIGLYKYYADIAPAVLKFLRWLLALPGGDRQGGLAQMIRTRDAGVLMRTEAAYQLYLIDIWYEQRADRGLVLLEELQARHPHNPLFLVNIAQLHEVYRSDHPAARATYQRLVDGARDGTLREAGLAEVWGQRGVAAQFDALAESDAAIAAWREVLARRPAAPYGVLAATHLDIGRALDRLGRRDEALAAYRAARAALPADDPEGLRRRIDAGLQAGPPRAAAEAYRLSLEGWRALERGAVDEAGSALARAVQLTPDDGVVRVRHGLWALARRDTAGAQADFTRALQVRPRPPAPFVARAHLESGHLARAAGARAEAARHYEQAARVRGAEPAIVAAARLARAALAP